MRQRRLSDIDTVVLSLSSRGLTSGEISAHFAEVYGASVSKDDHADHRLGAWGDGGVVVAAVGAGLCGDLHRRDRSCWSVTGRSDRSRSTRTNRGRPRRPQGHPRDEHRNAGLPPMGLPNGRVRRVGDVVTDYIVARENSALAPIAIRTVRDCQDVLENHVSRKRANIGRVPVCKLTVRDIRQWMDALWETWVQALPSVIPRPGMDLRYVTDLDAHRRMS